MTDSLTARILKRLKSNDLGLFLRLQHRMMSHISLTLAGYLTVHCFIHHGLHIFAVFRNF